MTAPKIDKILSNLCHGIEIPKIKNTSNENAAQRLIEQVEINNYSYQPIICQHLEEKGIGEDCVECQQKQYETYKSRFYQLAEEKGVEHTHTLKAAFDYYSTLITRYFLTECDELFNQIYPSCIARGAWSVYYIMAIQALAFLRFKQGRYQESLEYFHKQVDALGPNEMIYENMALAYSRLEKFAEASACYAQAILLIRQKPSEQQQFSTLLMGLATVLDNTEDSLTVLEESMRLLKMRFDKPHSLMAKTLSAMGDLYLKRNDKLAAEKCFNEAVQIFIETCGIDTPLTSNAMNKHAKSLLLLGKNQEACKVFSDALSVWIKVDDASFDSNRVVEALLFLKEEGLKINHNKLPESTVIIIENLQKKIIVSPVLSNDLNSLCLLKFIYELFIMNQDFSRAMTSCQLFVEHLEKLNKENLGEFKVHRDNLLQEAASILSIMQTLKK